MDKQKEVKFYMNNPCVVIRDVNDLFCEIQLNTHFAANIEASSYIEPSECRAPLSSFPQDEYDSISYLIEEIQDEEHSIICMIEKRLLHDDPIEASSIKSLQKEINKQHAELQSTKDLHEEWRNSLKALKLQSESLKSEIKALELSVASYSELNDTAKNGAEKLAKKYNGLLVAVGHGDKKISIHEYDQLLKRNEVLCALEAGGVDNWQWFEESLSNAGLID